MADKTKYKIYDELAKIKSSYNTSINLLEAETGLGALQFLQKLKIRMIEFYTNSRYLTTQKDELGRDKPFYNILNGVIDTENAAKNIDTKDLSVMSMDGQHTQQAFLLGKELKIWMNEEQFGKTLNQMADVHSRYGSLLVKKYRYTDDEGVERLCLTLPEWKNIWNDQIDLENGPIVEVHWMLPSELMKKKGWKNQKEAIEAAQKEHPKRRRIPVYEMRGEFGRSLYNEVAGKGEAKTYDDDFSYQLYYLAGEVDGKLTCLYSEDDTEEVYMYLARKKKPGRSFGVGIPEEGEEAQVWTNDAVLKQYRALEYSGKVVGQSASKKLRGRNMLTEVDDGAILEHEDGKPITTVPLVPPGGMAQFGNIIAQWYDQFEKATSAYNAQRGQQALSHTPARLQMLLIQQSKAVFDTLRQDMGLFIEDIFNEWVLPFLVEQLTSEHILAGDFSAEELQEIDKNFATYEANQQAKSKILAGQIVTQEEYDSYVQMAKEMMGKNKGRRFLSIPKNYYKNLQAKVYVITTGEQLDKAKTLEDLSNIMMIYSKNPQMIQDPVLALLFKQAIELSGIGISSVEIMAAINEQAKLTAEKLAQQTQQPGGGNPPAGPGGPPAPGGAGMPTPGAGTPVAAPVPAAPNPIKQPAYGPTR